MKYLTIIFFALTFSSCTNSSDKIIGEWERINDENKGIVIIVTKEKNNYVGKLTEVPKESLKSGFAIDDVKWKNIEFISEGNYKFKDLHKSMQNDQIYEIGYGDGYIELNDNKILIKHTKQNKTGLKQEWIKKN